MEEENQLIFENLKNLLEQLEIIIKEMQNLFNNLYQKTQILLPKVSILTKPIFYTYTIPKFSKLIMLDFYEFIFL